MLKAWVLVIAALCLCGCDSYYGISREVMLQQPLMSAQIELALREVPQTREYECETAQEIVAWNIHGTKRYPAYEQYIVSIANKRLSIASGWNEEHRAFVRMGYGRLNQIPTANELELARATMDKVYGALRQGEPSLPPKERVEEKQYGVPRRVRQ